MKKIIPFRKEIIFKTNLAEITSISLEHTLNTQNKDIEGNFIISGDYKISDTSINTEDFSYDLPFHITMDDKYILDNIILDIDDFYYEIINNNILSIHIDVLIDKLEEVLIEDLVIEDDVDEEKDVSELFEETEELVRKEEIEEETSEDEILIERKEELNQMESDKFEEFLESLNEESLNSEKIHEEKLEENNIITTLKEEEKEIKEEKRCIEDEGLFSNLNAYSETYKSYKIYIVRDGDSIESILEKYGISKDKLEEYNDLKELKIGDKIIIPT